MGIFPKRNLSLKIIGSIVGAILIVVPLVGYFSLDYVRTALENAYLEKALTIARLLDAGIQSGSDLDDKQALFEVIQRSLWLEPDILAIDVCLSTPDGLVIAISSNSLRNGNPASPDNIKSFRDDVLVQRSLSVNYGRLLRVITPIHVAKRQAGTFQLDLSLDLIDRQVAATLRMLSLGYLIIVAVVSLLGFLMLKRIVLSPLKEIGVGIASVASGKLDHRVVVTSEDEIGRLAQSFNQMGKDLMESNNTIQNLAYKDALTGLPNRRLLLDRLSLSVARCRRENLLGALLYLDIDHFKDINDTLGHGMGDKILITVSRYFQDHLRATDTVARLGGDEFVILLADGHGEILLEFHQVAEKLRQQISEPMKVDGHTLRITVSIGLHLFPESGETLDDIIRKADTALYHAKDKGRNRSEIFNEEMQDEMQQRSALRQELKQGIVQDELFLVYQPQVRKNGELAGVEALVRWQHPQRGLLMPDRFIPVAEGSDLISSLGEWVLNAACRDYQRWVDSGCMDYSVQLSINVSPHQFYDSNFVSTVSKIVEDFPMLAERLDLEITEDMLAGDFDVMNAKMRELNKLGVRFMLDDFGTGYSSLSYLKRLSVDGLKIDRTFVKDICHSADDALIVETMLTVARQYKLEVVAEGIESADQRDFLFERGCHLFQGYYFSRPVLEQEFFDNYLRPSMPANKSRYYPTTEKLCMINALPERPPVRLRTLERLLDQD